MQSQEYPFNILLGFNCYLFPTYYNSFRLSFLFKLSASGATPVSVILLRDNLEASSGNNTDTNTNTKTTTHAKNKAGAATTYWRWVRYLFPSKAVANSPTLFALSPDLERLHPLSFSLNLLQSLSQSQLTPTSQGSNFRAANPPPFPSSAR